MSEPRIDFLIPKDLWLTSNGRYHHMAKAGKVRELRQLGNIQARAQRLQVSSQPMRAAIYVGYATQRRADPPNAYPTVKPLVDGLVDAGVFRDDDDKHIPEMAFLRAPEKVKAGLHGVRMVFEPWKSEKEKEEEIRERIRRAVEDIRQAYERVLVEKRKEIEELRTVLAERDKEIVELERKSA